MTGSMHKCTGTVRMCIGVTFGLWLAASTAQAGTVTVAVTPSVVDEVEAVAEAFETTYSGDHVRIVISPETELKGQAKKLPVQLVVSDDLSFIEWMEARGLASRLAIGPAVSVPLAVVASSSSGGEFGSLRDLRQRMQQQDTKIAIIDPQRSDCGRRAQALLKAVGFSAELSDRLVFAKHTEEVLAMVQNGKAHFGLVFAPDAITAKGVAIHAVSAPPVSSPVHIFAVKQGQQDHAVAQRFLAFVNTPEGQQALRARGYELVQDAQLVVAAATTASIAPPSISR